MLVLVKLFCFSFPGISFSGKSCYHNNILLVSFLEKLLSDLRHVGIGNCRREQDFHFLERFST